MKVKWKRERLFILIGLLLYAALIVALVSAVPIPPTTITNYSAETMGATGSVGKNASYSGNGTHAGGYIFTVNIQSKVQNKRWKAFVGNVTGKLTLDDASGYTVFDWDAYSGTAGGEVYATRWASTITWININCTWGYLNNSNKTVLEYENIALSQNRTDDNLTRTFNDTLHSAFTVGNRIIPANSCFSARTYNYSSRHETDVFTEIVLYDGTTDTDGKIVYATKIDTTDLVGYKNGTSYDFQMIVPENASPSSSGTLPYYFYVELE